MKEHETANTGEDTKKRLFAAVKQGDADAIRLLIQAGANVNVWHIGETPLRMAVKQGNVNTVRLLIEAGANIEAADASGITLLHLAVMQGNTDVVLLLIRRGADMSATAESVDTPCTWRQSKATWIWFGY